MATAAAALPQSSSSKKFFRFLFVVVPLCSYGDDPLPLSPFRVDVYSITFFLFASTIQYSPSPPLEKRVTHTLMFALGNTAAMGLSLSSS
jgi:hypothetical protein